MVVCRRAGRRRGTREGVQFFGSRHRIGAQERDEAVEFGAGAGVGERCAGHRVGRDGMGDAEWMMGNEEWKMEQGEPVSDISGMVLVLLDKLILKHGWTVLESRDIWKGGVKGRGIRETKRRAAGSNGSRLVFCVVGVEEFV